MFYCLLCNILDYSPHESDLNKLWKFRFKNPVMSEACHVNIKTASSKMLDQIITYIVNEEVWFEWEHNLNARQMNSGIDVGRKCS